MTFLTDWQTWVDSSLAEITELVELDRELELTYGLVATGLLWPIRAQVDEYDEAAIQAVKKLAPQGSRALLRFLQGWSPDKLAGAHEISLAAKKDAELRLALDQIITHFNGVSIFLHHLLEKKLAGQEEHASYDVSGLVQGLLVNLGGSTTVQQLNITVGSMIAGNSNVAHFTPASQPVPEELLEPYLRWLIVQHERLVLRGIKQSGGLTGIPLESVYIALRGDRTSAYEREQSHILLENELSEFEQSLSQHELSFEERRTLLWEALGRSPWMLSLEERDRPHLFHKDKTEKLSLGEAFRRERWLALLGDPGSGKTTVARWLTLKMAQALLAGQERLEVPESQVDPASGKANLTDLGSARLPVLVKISEFADACRDKPGLLLADFLGWHSWLGEFPTYGNDHADKRGEALPATQLNLLLKKYIKQGQAVIILDGLDEISVADNRIIVIQAIEKFIRDFITPITEKDPVHSEQAYFRAYINTSTISPSDYPANRGGNQIVITSRIAGYHADPLGGEIAHFTIDPMNDVAVDAFADAWMKEIYEDAIRATQESEAFKAEIHNPNNPGVRELASNPLLLTILALIYQDGQSRLPRQRVSLYRMAVDNLARIWQQRGHGLKRNEVLYVLTQIAYHIHETYATGLIEVTAVREQIARSLAEYRKMPYKNFSTNFVQNADFAAFEEEVDYFMKVLREEVGLLAARGERLYGFLHLSFQEYFAALYLIQNPRLASKLFTEKLDKPRWREPLLLAFGHISISWTPEMREELFSTFLRSNDGLKHLLPRGAILLANALGEMTSLPSKGIIHETIQNLLDTYSGKGEFLRFDLLYTTIEEAFENLNKTKAAPIVEATLVEELQNINQKNWSRGFAAAQIMFKMNWFTVRATRALLKALPFDNAAWDWVINKSLIHITRIHPEYLPSYELSFRYALQQNPETLTFIKNDVAWLRVITLLFGGIVSQEVGEKTEDDKEKGGVEFLPTNIYRNALLSKTILRGLQDQSLHRDIRKLENSLRDIWRNSKVETERAEALLSLSALGVSLDTFTREKDGQQSEAFKTALSYADLVTDLLKPLFVRAIFAVKRELAVYDFLAEDNESILNLLHGLIKFERGLQTPIAGSAHLFFSREYKMNYLEIALYFSEMVDKLLQNKDDPVYSTAVVLDIAGPFLAHTSTETAQGLAFLQEFHPSSRWLQIENFPPPANNYYAEFIAEALNVIDGISLSLDCWRHWSLEEIAEVLREQQPEMIPEALAVGLKINQMNLRQSALLAIAPELAEQQGDTYDLIFRLAMDLQSPLHKARCLWRLVQVLPISYFMDGLQEAIRSTALIANPRDKSRMYWRLGHLHPNSQQKEMLFQLAYDYALKISDHTNKAWALARLAVHFPKQEKRLLSLVLDEIGKVQDERKRAEMLQKMRSIVTSTPVLQTRLESMVEKMRSPQMRWLAQGQLLPLLFAYKPKPENNENYMLVSLIVCLHELRRTFGIPLEIEEIWLALADKQRRDGAAEALQLAGIQDGLKLTPVAADALTTLINQEDLSTLARLFPLVQGSDPGLQALFLQWLQSPHVPIQQMASLLLAETDYLSVNTFPHMIALLTQGEDRLKHRAALALYDKKTNNGLPRFKSSAIGQDTLVLVTRTYKTWRQLSPNVQSTLAWVYENVWIDDGEQIKEWARQVQMNWHEDTQIYARLLESIHVLTRKAWDGFLYVLENGNDDVQCLLLHSYIHILSISKALLDQLQEEKLRGLLHEHCLKGQPRVRLWALEALGFYSSPTEADRQILLTVAEDTHDALAAQAVISFGRLGKEEHTRYLLAFLKSPRQAIRAAAAEALLREKILNLNDEATDGELTQVIDEMLELLADDPLRLYQAELDASRHRWYGRYQENAARLGGLIIERYASLLLERLMHDLTQILERPEDLDIGTIEELLDQTWLDDFVPFDIAAATAARMPTAFANLADPERLESHFIRFSHDGSGPQRTAAITLLSFMRGLSTGVAQALKNGLNDMVYSQEAVLQAVVRFRNLKGNILSTLASNLSNPSAAFAYATVQVLQALGTSETTSFADRQEIMKILADAIDDPMSKRVVYLMKRNIELTLLDDGSRTTNDKGVTIEYKGSLRTTMYQALMQVSGMSGAK